MGVVFFYFEYIYFNKDLSNTIQKKRSKYGCIHFPSRI